MWGFISGPTATSASAAEVVPDDSSSQPEVGTADAGEDPSAAGINFMTNVGCLRKNA